jgi:DNA-binding MarR family transcriptional regulator
MLTVVVNPSPGQQANLQREHPGLGPALRRAWVGYHNRLNAELAAAGFGDRGYPDGRVLRICQRSAETTISHIGRQLGMTRQGAGKIVASLRDRGYVALSDSPTDGREKIVELTERAVNFLDTHRRAARQIEGELRAAVGPERFDDLYRILAVLEGGSPGESDTASEAG